MNGGVGFARLYFGREGRVGDGNSWDGCEMEGIYGGAPEGISCARGDIFRDHTKRSIRIGVPENHVLHWESIAHAVEFTNHDEYCLGSVVRKILKQLPIDVKVNIFYTSTQVLYAPLSTSARNKPHQCIFRE